MTPRATPMMAQYLEWKGRHPDSILLFRMGDFYEMFFDDAKEAASLLGLTLTARGKHGGSPIPMAGVPYHSVEGYVRRLVEAGRRVAICEQVEAARKSKGLVRREVTDVVTPGTLVRDDADGLGERRFIAALAPGEKVVGLALAEVATGALAAGEFAPRELVDEIARHKPAEVVVPGAWELPFDEDVLGGAALVREVDPFVFTRARGHEALTRQLGVADLAGFGCEDLDAGVAAAGGLLRHLRALKGDALDHFTSVRRLTSDGTLTLDAASLRHLEVLEAPEGGRSLAETIDRTQTAMGSRFLRDALARPLARREAIEERLSSVDALVSDDALRARVETSLSRMFDLERLVGRIGARRARARDISGLATALACVLEVKDALRGRTDRLGELALCLDPSPELASEIERALVDEPPGRIGDGETFRAGHDAALDALREGAREGRAWIAALEDRERATTGIPNLRVGYNRVFGYYIEVTRSHLERVPGGYQRKQTLVGAERFVTEDLKVREAEVLGADERERERETELLGLLLERVREHIRPLAATARALAEIDCIRSFAETAIAYRYVRPTIEDGGRMEVRGGRHPVVERLLPEGSFIPNGVELDPTARQILLVTGPNMAGKSTYLRQVGLIALLAHAGSFVPADAAVIGVTDRIFTRVGASDNLARGRSTFLVEMQESANILHNATTRSLVLLDEVGRGTSTFDGLSIAWAMTEHLHDGMAGRPRTLFATHFHELTALAERLARVVNLRVEVDEWEDQIVFRRKIVEGRADRSYGIHVAEMAGLPGPVLERAREILRDLETRSRSGPDRPTPASQPELPLSTDRALPRSLARIARALSALDPERLTPIEALSRLAAMREMLEEPEPPAGKRGLTGRGTIDPGRPERAGR